MAKTRKGYYRAGHYVKSTSVSSRAKKPASWMVVVGAFLLIAAWNTVFDDDGGKATPKPQRTAQSVTESPSR